MDMKNLLQIRKSRKKYLVDEKIRQREATNQKRDPLSTQVKSVIPKAGTGTAGQLETADVDLTQIGQAYYSDAYISRAVNKVVGLMFKEGWFFNSKNKEALEYVQSRFNLIEESTDIKTEELLRELGSNFVLYANAPAVKTRGSENLANLKAEGYYGGEPISGIFPVNPETFQVIRDEFGNFESFSVGEGATVVEFAPEDVEHMTYHRPTGRAFGVPYITNTLRDVLVLRQIEEIVSKMLYRNLHPLQVFTVGKAEAGWESQEGEVELVQEEIQNMPLDSMLVVPERYSIQTVSSGGSYLQAQDYLKYFRQRIFTGLGVSESVMGIGDTSNRSTSDNQSSDLIDLVKDFQQNFSAEFQKIVNEILFEGGFDPTLVPEDRVSFVFTEIEQASKIARENHEIQKFNNRVQSLDETRENMGYEPTTDYSTFIFNLDTSAKEVDGSGTVENSDMPSNQHGTADSPTKDSMKDAYYSKKVKNNENTELTDLSLMVTLLPDDALFSEQSEKFKRYWSDSLNYLKKSNHYSIENFSLALENAIPAELFSSIEDKEFFCSLASKQAESFYSKEQSLDSLYHFETFLTASYLSYHTLEEGGQT